MIFFVFCGLVVLFKLLMSFFNNRNKNESARSDAYELTFAGEANEYFSGIIGAWNRLVVKNRLVSTKQVN